MGGNNTLRSFRKAKQTSMEKMSQHIIPSESRFYNDISMTGIKD